MKTIIALSALVLFLLAPPVISQIPDDKLIVPGQRIGKWRLAMTVDQLVQMNGQSEPSHSRGQDLQPDINVLYWLDRIGLNVGTRDRRSIAFLLMIDSDYATKKRIRVGAHKKAIESAYGKPTAFSGGPRSGQSAMTYDAIGVRFVLDSVDTVWAVQIFRPRTARSIWKLP